MNKIIIGDAFEALRHMPDESVDICVTSPPYYGLRDYGVDGQIGLENKPEEYINRLVKVFNEVKRTLKNDGTLWIVIADSYADRKKATTADIKQKDLIGIPWMLAFALRADGWYLRSDIIWHKPNAMPESVKDRPAKCYEHIFLLAKSRRYYYDAEAVLIPAQYDGRKDTYNKDSSKYANMSVAGKTPEGLHIAGKPHERWRFKDGQPVKNRRDVWSVNTKPYKGQHLAPYPPELITPCILAGCRPGGIVLDPFIGSGTTAEVSNRLGRGCIGIDINPANKALILNRLNGEKHESSCRL